MKRPEIKAIETPYKGYRFRSRLEARWGVFYDAIGARWTYENDPFNVAGFNYLPDFKVTLKGEQCFHEVKPESEFITIRPQVVYLAGKMKPDFDWRGSASPLRRDTSRGAEYGSVMRNRAMAFSEEQYTVWFENVGISVIGPLPAACDHGCSHRYDSIHMAEACGETDLRSVSIACMSAIASSDVFCAHLNTKDCYGTLVEIGLARGTGSTVSVTISEELSAELSEVGGHYDTIGRHDLWFATSLADHSAVVENDAEARQFHADVIKNQTCREYQVISGIAEAGYPAVLTFGDPSATAHDWSALEWGVDIRSICRAHPKECAHARSYRFT